MCSIRPEVLAMVERDMAQYAAIWRAMANGECDSTIEFSDDYGDNGATFHCQLPAGHEGFHIEQGVMNDSQPYLLTWIGDNAGNKMRIAMQERADDRFWKLWMGDQEDKARACRDIAWDVVAAVGEIFEHGTKEDLVRLLERVKNEG